MSRSKMNRSTVTLLFVIKHTLIIFISSHLEENETLSNIISEHEISVCSCHDQFNPET